MSPASAAILPSVSAPRTPAPGVLVAGVYRLDAKIGEGGMGTVWSAEDVRSGQRVALKVLKVGAPDARLRFLREAWAASAARHPNVVDVLDTVTAEGEPLVIVMELLAGEALGTALAREGPLSIAKTCATLLPVVDALAAVHRLGMVHRDVKPDNVFVEARPHGGQRIKLLDFGVAKLTSKSGQNAEAENALFTMTEGMLGTPYYMAPEQIFAEHDVDARADIWSLGVMFYECATGARPTEAPTVGHILRRIALDDLVAIDRVLPDIPEELAALVTRMLAHDRALRPSLEEIHATLARHTGALAQSSTFSRCTSSRKRSFTSWKRLRSRAASRCNASASSGSSISASTCASSVHASPRSRRSTSSARSSGDRESRSASSCVRFSVRRKSSVEVRTACATLSSADSPTRTPGARRWAARLACRATLRAMA